MSNEDEAMWSGMPPMTIKLDGRLLTRECAGQVVEVVELSDAEFNRYAEFFSRVAEAEMLRGVS